MTPSWDYWRICKSETDGASTSMDEHVRNLIQEICERFKQLQIMETHTSHDGSTGLTTITAVAADGASVVLASLTSAERMCSTADLAAHILLLLHLQAPVAARTPTAVVECDPLLTVYPPQATRTPMAPISHDTLQAFDVSQSNVASWATGSSSSQSSIAASRQNGITYPSALVDVINIAGCSIPDPTYF